MSAESPVAIVTGGASGMGLACVKHFVSRGYKVVIADLDHKKGQAVADELATKGKKVIFVESDLSVYEQQQALFARAFRWGGERLDVLAANAGIDDVSSMYEDQNNIKTQKIRLAGDSAEIDVPARLGTKTIDVCLDAPLQGIWLFRYFNHKSQQLGHSKNGKVVITSSIAGLYGLPSNPQYSAAKSGVINLVRAVGDVLLASDNITVNAICPAFVATALTPQAFIDAWPKKHQTPISTILKTYDTFLDDDKLTGAIIECSGHRLHFKDIPEPPDESIAWILTESGPYWDALYKGTPYPPNVD